MLELKTLGGLLIVATESTPVSGAATQRRRLALLAVLAAAGRSGVTREKLIGLFWPDLDVERARAALAQALYALRQGVGSDEVVEGISTLRLNESVLTSDVARFRRAIAERRDFEAADCWTGPFLDGVVVPGAPEFDRWAEAERGALDREALEVFERLARAATHAGDAAAAVRWWQRRVAIDPLAGAGAVGLMNALAAMGDRAAALRHARVYETLIATRLDLPPDATVVALAVRLRSELDTAPPPPARRVAPGPATRPASPIGAPPVLESDAAAHPRGPARARLRWAVPAVVVVVAIAFAAVRGRSPAPATPVVAVGAFHVVGPELAAAGRSLSDMFATSLAQAPALQVISTARLYEVLRPGSDTGRAMMAAARAAGATHLIDGSAYQTAGGVRLDLRRISLASGEVVHAVSVTAPDLFAAVDSGTPRLLASLGGARPPRPIADLTTSSLVAYRLYVEGLRAYHEGHAAAALRFFTAALDEDSTFAMAAYYAALSTEGSGAPFFERLARAARLAEGAGERERLLIQWYWADQQDHPSRAALAETLVTRFASEPFAHFHNARAMIAAGHYGQAQVSLRRAIALDLGGALDLAPGRCIGCEARVELATLLRGLDSAQAAEREAREFVRVDGESHHAWHALMEALLAQGRGEEAIEAAERAGEVNPRYDVGLTRALIGIHTGSFDFTNAELLRRFRSAGAPVRAEAAWWLQFAWREQGRLDDAMEVARTLRATDSTHGQRGAAPYAATAMAAVLYEQGRFRAAAALWDSIARLRTPGTSPSRHARHRAWFLTLAATAHAAAGDTAALSARADSVEELGRQSSYIRDQRLHHHVRGLLYQARGRDAEAAEAFRASLLRPTVTYSRSQVARARSLHALQRDREAIAVLRPLLAGPLDGSNTYVTRTELHELLAELFLAAGQPDSAATHAARVVDAWRFADPRLSERRERMAVLAGRSTTVPAPELSGR